MNQAPRRLLPLFLCASLVGGLIPPEAVRAAALVRLTSFGEAGASGLSAGAAAAAPLTLGAPALSAPLSPAASLISVPFLAAPSASAAAAAAPEPAAALTSARAAASAPADEVPAAAKAAAPAATRSWLSRASALFARPSAPVLNAAPVSAAAAKAESGRAFDGAASASAAGDAVAAPSGGSVRRTSGLRGFAARGLEAYRANRAVAHDDFGGPRSDGPMTFRAKVRYGLKWGLNLVGLSALIDLAVAPLASHFAWPLLLSPSALPALGRVELLTKFGPAAIGQALAHAPLAFLGFALPFSTAMEEVSFRFFGFGLTFGLLAAAKPVANLAANLLDAVPDASAFRSTVQRGVLDFGELLSFFAFPVAALTSSFSFAVAHFAQWGVDPSVFALNMAAGWVLARAAYKTRGLTAPFVAHLFFNVAMLGSAILGVTFGLPLAAAVYAAAAALAGVASLVYNWRAARGSRPLSLKAGAKNLLVAALIAGSLLGTAGAPSSRGSFASNSAALAQVQTQAATVPTPAVEPAAARAAAPAAGEPSAFKTDADMVAAVKPSVVEIIVGIPGGYELGSGVIVSPTGLLVTNGHVVGDKRVGEIAQVKLADDRKVPAKIMAVNHNRDLAILQLPTLKDGAAWPYSTFAKTVPREGDALFAMGHPLGLPFTVTKGILSGLGYRGNMFVQYLQTDAAITHGNSGGPIYNERGEVVGINTMGPEVGGIGFSIMAPSVAHALNQYLATGNIATAALGVIVDLSSPDLPKTGVAVEFVRPGSAAAKAGLRPGDLVVGLGGAVLRDGGRKAVHDLAAVLAQAKPGDRIELAVLRAGSDKPVIVKLTLDARATSEETSMAHGFDGEDQP